MRGFVMNHSECLHEKFTCDDSVLWEIQITDGYIKG